MPAAPWVTDSQRASPSSTMSAKASVLMPKYSPPRRRAGRLASTPPSAPASTAAGMASGAGSPWRTSTACV